MNTLTISKSVSGATTPSPRVLATAAMFGLGVDDTKTLTLVPRCDIPLPHLNGRSGIVFITGPSGSGKSTILRLIHDALANTHSSPGAQLHHFDNLPSLPDRPLVDALDDGTQSLEELMAILAIVGLSDAFVMLRRRSELSDGQRYRLRLAQSIAAMMTHSRLPDLPPARVMLADEFASTLDRITAQTIARNLRRWVNRQSSTPPYAPLSVIVATAHDDLLEALEPDVLIWKGLGDELEVVAR